MKKVIGIMMDWMEMEKNENKKLKMHRKPKKTKAKKYNKGMLYSRNVGIKLAKEHPEIVEDFRNMMTYLEIADKYEIPYSSVTIGINVVYNCMKRFVEDEIISGEEFLKLRKKRYREFGKRGGEIVGPMSFEKKIGCFGISPERRSEISRETAKRMGDMYGKHNYRYLQQMNEEDKKLSRIKCLANNGYVAYDEIRLELPQGYMNEREYVVYLREEKKLPWRDLGFMVNKFFGNSRNFEAIRTSYNSNWRRKE